MCLSDVTVALLGMALTLEFHQPKTRRIALGRQSVHRRDFTVKHRQGLIVLADLLSRGASFCQRRLPCRRHTGGCSHILSDLRRNQAALRLGDVDWRSRGRREVDTMPSERVGNRTITCHVDLGGEQRLLGLRLVRGRNGRIKVDQRLATSHDIAVADVDPPHDPRIDGLHQLHRAGWRDLALRGGDDIDAAEHQPGNRRDEPDQQHPRGDPPGGRYRPLYHLERGRQEIGIAEPSSLAGTRAFVLHRLTQHAPMMRQPAHALTPCVTPI